MSTAVIEEAKVAEKGKSALPSKITIEDEEIMFTSLIGDTVYYRLPIKGLEISWKKYMPFFRHVLTVTIKGFIIFYALIYLILLTIIWGPPKFILPPVILNIAKSIWSAVAWKHEETFLIFFVITFIVLWLINLEVVLKTEKEEIHVYSRRWKLKPLILLSEKSKSGLLYK